MSEEHRKTRQKKTIKSMTTCYPLVALMNSFPVPIALRHLLGGESFSCNCEIIDMEQLSFVEIYLLYLQNVRNYVWIVVCSDFVT